MAALQQCRLYLAACSLMQRRQQQQQQQHHHSNGWLYVALGYGSGSCACCSSCCSSCCTSGGKMQLGSIAVQMVYSQCTRRNGQNTAAGMKLRACLLYIWR
jgi:hypothetical protein